MKIKKKRRAFRRRQKKSALPLSEFFLSKSGKSRIQELRIRDDINGNTAMGGNFWGWGKQKHDRGDVENSSVLVEAKQTKKPYFSLSENILKKIDKESFNHRKTPSVVIEFLEMPFGTEAMWAVVPSSFIHEKLDENCLMFSDLPKFKTKNKQVRLKILDLKKIDQEATAKRKIPAVMVEFKWMGGGVPNEWIIIPYSIFLTIAKPAVSNSEPESDDDSEQDNDEI